ncbi:hypothetical protein SAMN05216358_0709 [Rhizobium sp. AN5]|uniref:hypothetical protein n=1 Tax=Rhizobium sp. AN5 TaxID=1855304 RepID=UPI000BCAEA33|nr:hypothetical protein [Rhizobium sp. AN5]SOC90617.1 hypothetical protein SAMN05216358_0709 [Rhizobium sp. AN5]
MTAKSIPIEDLRLDIKNPRIADASSQRDALLKIVTDQDVKLVALAESIVEDGLNPMDRFLVIPSDEEPNKYIVLEGNRRLAALKILRNPTVLTGMQVRGPVQKRLEDLAATFDRDGLADADCFDIVAREDAAMWINQRHTGENEGRGIVDWSGVASARFRGNDPALQALDFVTMRGNLTEVERARIAERFPITTLDRLLSTPAVRGIIGVDIKGGKLLSGLPFAELIKPLQRMVRDLASGTVTVTNLKRQPQMVAYASGLDADLPDPTTVSSSILPIEAILPLASSAASGASNSTSTAGGSTGQGGNTGQGSTGAGGSGGAGGSSAAANPGTKKKSASRGPALIPRACVLRVTNTKIAEVTKELRTLHVKTYPHAISVLFRVFLELSVDEYLKQHGISLTLTVQGGRMTDKKLAKKVDEAVQHMVSAGAPAKEFTGITKALSDKSNPLHPDTLHAYVHNAFYSPTERDLTVAWDNAQPFFERLWP